MNILEELKNSVESGHYKTTEEIIQRALKGHIPAIKLVEESMVPAMRQMGRCRALKVSKS